MHGIGDVDAPARIHGHGVAVADEIQDAVVIPVSHVESAKRIYRQPAGEIQTPSIRPAAIALSVVVCDVGRKAAQSPVHAVAYGVAIVSEEQHAVVIPVGDAQRIVVAGGVHRAAVIHEALVKFGWPNTRTVARDCAGAIVARSNPAAPIK